MQNIDGINFVYFTVDYVPEILKVPSAALVLNQVRPLSTRLAPAGSEFVQDNAAALWGLGLAALLIVVAHTPLRHVAVMGWASAAGLIISLLITVLPPLLQSWSAVATSGVLTLVIAGYGIAAAKALPQTASAKTQMPRVTSGWIILYLVVAVGPLAIGRLLRGGAYAAAAANPVQPEESLMVVSSWWFFLVGAAAGIAVWAVIQLIPPWSGRRITGPIILLVLAVGGGLAMAGDIAASYAVAAN